MKKEVKQSKPPTVKQSKLANTSSKPKQGSHRIAPNLEFSNTLDDPIEIEEAEEEVSMQREEIVFTKDESNKQDSFVAFEGGHSSNDPLEYENGHFLTDQGSVGQTPLAVLPSIPPANILPFLYFLIINF